MKKYTITVDFDGDVEEIFEKLESIKNIIEEKSVWFESGEVSIEEVNQYFQGKGWDIKEITH